MKHKKHIDELFKEKLQHYEASPSPEVWEGIQARMKKKKKDRKVIPLWWRLGGVAAAIALLIALGELVFNPNEGQTQEGTIVTNEVEDTNSGNNKEDQLLDQEVNTDGLTVEDAQEEDTTSEKESDNKSEADQLRSKTADESLTKFPNKTREAVAQEESNPIPSKETNSNRVNKIDATPIKEGVAEVENQNSSDWKKDPKTDPKIVDAKINKANEGVAKTVDEKNPLIKDSNIKDQKEGIDTPIKDVKAATTGIAKTDTKTEETKTDNLEDPQEKTKSIFDAIEENEETAVAENESDVRNWEVTPNFGPVFYNSLNEGSSIDPAFADNAQSGDTNFSYGVQVSYNFNDRLSLRSGINNVALGYSTSDVEVATGPLGLALGSVNYDGGRSQVTTVVDKGSLSVSTPPPGDPFSNLRPKSTGGNAEIIQDISYYEVPMELKYALVKRRFGVNMIGGFSTLFLGNNEISVRDGDFSEVLGSANNLNSVSFSTNFGLGFDYKISERLKFNVEPMFKYQLNPYSDTSVDFRPYYFGIYSGLSFKF